MSAHDLTDVGTSIWLDDLSRSKITSQDRHALPHRISHDSVVGVTTNPSIFAAAIAGTDEYTAAIADMRGQSAEEIVRVLTTDDVRAACDLFHDIYQRSAGKDGRVSIEVDPRLAHQTEATIQEGTSLHALVNRENVMIKVPATLSGLPAITALIAEGISVNVTLIFSLARYAQVIDAFMSGLEARAAQGLPLSRIHSVASFFVSRIDTAIDPVLKELGRSDLAGRAAVANAHLAYELFRKEQESDRWQALSAQGAHMQRPLWASTGVKNPDYEDTRYVIELAAPDCVNTMPQSTLDALIDHGVIRGDAISNQFGASRTILTEIESVGISLTSVTSELEEKGVASFSDSWVTLLQSVEKAISQ